MKRRLLYAPYLGAAKGREFLLVSGKQYCQAGQHYVKRVGNTKKGWKCPACEAKGK